MPIAKSLSFIAALTAGLLLQAGSAIASPVIDGTFSASDGYGASQYHVNKDAFGPGLDFYFTSDANKVYGAIVSTDGTFVPSNDFQPYVYSDNRQGGAYGDGNDFIIYGTQRVAFSRDGAADGVYEYSPSTNFTQSGNVYTADITSAVVNGGIVDTGVSRGTVTVGFAPASNQFEFSIDRSLLGSVASVEYNGRFFNYFNNTTLVENLAAVPEPTSLSALGLASVGLISRRRRA